MSTLDRKRLDAIAQHFLPSRWHYHYVRSKLATDPLYPGVTAALGDDAQPLLDLGCGIGLLAHYLHAAGRRAAYLGVDNDGAKIGRAQAVAERAGLVSAHFREVDLGAAMQARQTGADGDSLFEHRGSVAILDVLQFLPPQAQAPLLRAAADCVAPGGRLLIRTGLAGSSWRARVTRAVDDLSRVLRWMNTGPKVYPERAELASLLSAAGLQVTFAPLWGGTPFNNWLVVAERPLASPSATVSSAFPPAGSGSVGSTQS
jgi:2-polyprenyl-3-methyl-5-hydroxy-6-metoxy-1,4-benzoquinol methylase